MSIDVVNKSLHSQFSCHQGAVQPAICMLLHTCLYAVYVLHSVRLFDGSQSAQVMGSAHNMFGSTHCVVVRAAECCVNPMPGKAAFPRCDIGICTCRFPRARQSHQLFILYCLFQALADCCLVWAQMTL